jgi:hypothetical protein
VIQYFRRNGQNHRDANAVFVEAIVHRTAIGISDFIEAIAAKQ